MGRLRFLRKVAADKMNHTHVFSNLLSWSCRVVGVPNLGSLSSEPHMSPGCRDTPPAHLAPIRAGYPSCPLCLQALVSLATRSVRCGDIWTLKWEAAVSELMTTPLRAGYYPSPLLPLVGFT